MCIRDSGYWLVTTPGVIIRLASDFKLDEYYIVELPTYLRAEIEMLKTQGVWRAPMEPYESVFEDARISWRYMSLNDIIDSTGPTGLLDLYHGTPAKGGQEFLIKHYGFEGPTDLDRYKHWEPGVVAWGVTNEITFKTSFQPARFEAHLHNIGYRSSCRAIGEDPDGNIYVHTYGRHQFWINPASGAVTKWERFEYSDGRSPTIWKIFTDSIGLIYRGGGDMFKYNHREQRPTMWGAINFHGPAIWKDTASNYCCLLYTSDAADE